MIIRKHDIESIEMTQRYAKRSNKVLTNTLIQRRKNIVEFKETKEENIQ